MGVKRGSIEWFDTMDPGYHEKIFQRYALLKGRDIDFDVKLDLTGIAGLKATEQRTLSKTGLLIETGMTVPRESYYPVFSFFPDINILCYDKRGHGDSNGIVDNEGSLGDNKEIASRWKRERGLEALIGLGHSYGGMIMASASTEKEQPYEAIVLAGAPIELRKAGGLLPQWFMKTAVYFFNAAYLARRFSWDSIVTHHQPYNPVRFHDDPRIVSMKINTAQQFNDTMKEMPNLMEFLPKIKADASFFYGGNDTRLGMKERFTGDYKAMESLCTYLGKRMDILPGLSHRFNRKPENEFAFSFNSNAILSELRSVIDLYR